MALERPMHRLPELDWLRGLMLVLMTVTHLPTVFSGPSGQPFGYVSAAEGFVFLSAFLVGNVYTRMGLTRGDAHMRHALWRRAVKIYLAHAALLLLLVFALVPLALRHGTHAVVNLASFYRADPSIALSAGLLLAYNPPLLDILPMYVLLMAASPLVIRHGLRHGWRTLLVASLVLWVGAQVGAGRLVYDGFAASTGWPVPYRETGAFAYLAWQLMWMGGLWAGSRAAATAVAADQGRARVPDRFDRVLDSRALLVAAAAVALAFLAWRHVAGQVPPGPPALDAVLDKWHLGILRLIDFAALVLIVLHLRGRLARWAAHSPLTTLGKASLTVFCAHLLICLVALALTDEAGGGGVQWQDVVLLAGTLAALWGVARLHLATRRIAGPLRLALSARLSARMVR
jgi:hypothetical protein